MIRKREGFKGQKAIVLPHYIQHEAVGNPLTKLLQITDIGYYPGAMHHFTERPSGCAENILIFCTNGEGWVEADSSRKRIKYMNDNVFNRITLNQLAENAGLSVSQFSLVFKKKTSRSPIDYYTNSALGRCHGH